MSRKLRRRIIMAAGASIAGAAIPLAAACNAWAETDYIDISYDGKTVYDDFPGANSAYGASDIGTPAESGANGDYAEVYGPANDNVVGLANDSATTDSGDTAIYDGVGTTTSPSDIFSSYGDVPGAQIVNGTNSDAEVYGGGNADINLLSNTVEDQVSNSTAYATNGGFADVTNDGLAPTGVTVSGDYADANGTAIGTATNGLSAGVTPSVASVYDSGNSVATANDTGFNLTVQDQGAAVDLANGSDAYATNAGSGADIIGTGTTAVTGDTNDVGNGLIESVTTSNAYEIDGLSYTTFLSDLFGFGGAAAESTAFTDLLGLF
jgi:hypothetical protein